MWCCAGREQEGGGEGAEGGGGGWRPEGAAYAKSCTQRAGSGLWFVSPQCDAVEARIKCGKCGVWAFLCVCLGVWGAVLGGGLFFDRVRAGVYVCCGVVCVCRVCVCVCVQ